MIWIFLAVAFGIITFIKLGTMSVWMIVMAQTIKVLLIVITVGLIYFAYKYWRKS